MQVKDPNAMRVIDFLDPMNVRSVRVDVVEINYLSVHNSMEWKHSNGEGSDRNEGHGLEVHQGMGLRSDVEDAMLVPHRMEHVPGCHVSAT
jgi:hypothetical protein